MSSHDLENAQSPNTPAARKSDTIPQLVARVYEAAPAVVRRQILERLLQPLGVLSLLGVANGVFARFLFQGGGRGLSVPLEEVQKVNAGAVMALVDFVQQANVDAVDGLAQVLAASPGMAGSAAAAVLITVLVHRARSPHAGAGTPDDLSPGTWPAS
jgi:hypothetical protein